MEHANPLDFDRYTGPAGYFVLARQFYAGADDEGIREDVLTRCMDIFVGWMGGIAAHELPQHGYRVNRAWADRRVN